MNGTLTLVATPIGNMGDITLRALDALKSAALIACEDTRHTAILLSRYDIKKPLVSYQKFNEREASEKILAKLSEGADVALVSDAGMPCVSDPGAVAVQKAREAGFAVTVCPGASAVTSAAALAGISSFCFLGFPPEKKSERDKLFSDYSALSVPLIFYCSVHDINKNLDDFYAAFGERKAVIAREITKKFETVTQGVLSSLREENPRGEYVAIIFPAEKKPSTDADPLERLAELAAAGVEKKEAIKRVAKERGVPKDEIYKLTIDDKNDFS